MVETTVYSGVGIWAARTLRTTPAASADAMLFAFEIGGEEQGGLGLGRADVRSLRDELTAWLDRKSE